MKSLSWKISVILIALQSSGVINVKWYIFAISGYFGYFNFGIMPNTLLF